MTPPMPGLILTGVRDADAATAWLLRELEELPLGPFDHPVVLANHPALRRALTLGIARGTGCAASVRFVSPAGWVDEVAALEGTEGEWRHAAMSWRLMASLTEQVALLPHSAQQIVVGEDTVALLDLARAIAKRFRAYLLHRPEMLLRWEASEVPATDGESAERWQAALWRALVDGSKSRSPAQIVADVRAGRFRCPESLPSVILAVADPTMPPAVRDVLRAISNERSLRWCVVAPAGTDERAIRSERLRAATHALEPLGLAAMPPRAGSETTLLSRVQRLLAGDDPTPDKAREVDDTLTFHACHSPLREIETLRERLLAAMEAQPALRPHDVTLYVTSLERYLPAINAVFGVDEPGVPRLPYDVAGRPFGDRSQIAFVLLQILAASEGRATLEEVGALLRLPPIADAAGFSEQETESALSWALRAGIVWGADGGDRHERFQLPSLEAGTWRHGIDRLVLGVAMGRTDSPLGSVLPVSGDSAGQADLVGRLAAWVEDLFALFAELRTPRRADAWGEMLERTMRTFIAVKGSEDSESLRTVRAVIGEVLGEIANVSGGTPVTIEAVRTLLEQALEEKAGAFGHLRGGVRICRLEAGTVLPAHVVLIAGVDDALHPAGGGTPAWDLLQQPPQDEDPDRRADALDAFREAIGSARSRAHVAWTGFTMAKHELRAPSVAVSELRELACSVLDDEAQKELVRTEPAHPFSASLFSPEQLAGRMQSAARGWGEAAALIRTRGSSHQGFADEPLDHISDGSRVISLEALAACVKDPTLHFCRRTLGLLMQDEDEALAEREPQAVNPPDEKGVTNDLRQVAWRLEAAQRRVDVRGRDEIREWLRHQPEMPYGEEGKELAGAVADAWWPQVEQLRRIVWRQPCPVRLKVGEWTIIGRLDRLTAEARVVQSLYATRPHSAVSQWVPHLVMNALAAHGEELPRETRMVGMEEWTLGAVDEAEVELARLCAFYEEASVAPLPLFRRAGCAWLEALGVRPEAEADDETRARARGEAGKKWLRQRSYGSAPAIPGEGDQAWNVLCWPDRGFDDDEEFAELFARCTERVLLPFMRARVVAELS